MDRHLIAASAVVTVATPRLGRPAFVALPDGGRFRYEYDGAQLDRIEAAANGMPPGTGEVVVSGLETHPGGGILGYEIHSDAFPTQSPVVTAYTYDPETYRLASAATTRDPYGPAPVVIQNLAYVHDRAGNLRTVTDQLGALCQEFFYDDLHRLLGAMGTGSQGDWTHSYVYDPAGNLREKGPVGTAETGRLKLHYSRTPGTPTSVTSVDFFIAATQSWWVAAAAYTYDADGGATAIRRAFSVYPMGRNADGPPMRDRE